MNMPDPSNHNGAMNIVVLADWGPSYNTGFTPVHETMKKVMNQKKLHLIIVVGDIAYDLNSQGGKRYIEFLEFVEELISRIPVVFIPGNHDNYEEDDKILLNSTFLAYNITNHKAFGFPFGDSYFIPYDPYLLLYDFDQK